MVRVKASFTLDTPFATARSFWGQNAWNLCTIILVRLAPLSPSIVIVLDSILIHKMPLCFGSGSDFILCWGRSVNQVMKARCPVKGSNRSANPYATVPRFSGQRAWNAAWVVLAAVKGWSS